MHGSPSAELGLVAEEGIPVGTAECLSMDKAAHAFTLQSLTWDPGFCTEHFLLHAFQLCGAVTAQPSWSQGGCVIVRPHKEDGVWCALHVNRHPPGDSSTVSPHSSWVLSALQLAFHHLSPQLKCRSANLMPETRKALVDTRWFTSR